MSKPSLDLSRNTTSVSVIVKNVDRDVERGEDILMLGYSLVLMAPIFAPIAPPHILLPLMALSFVVSVIWARANFYKIQRQWLPAIEKLEDNAFKLAPISEVLNQHPTYTLTDGFNPLKNLLRTAKSLLGCLLINPFWMPIFYTLGLQFAEEKHLRLLNLAVIKVEQRWLPPSNHQE